MSSNSSRIGVLAAALMIVGGTGALGQNYPSKPIRIYTGGAGGSNDFSARFIAQGISGPLGQPVVVENRPSGTISATIVAQSPPDGYNLILVGDIIWLNALLRDQADSIKDFAPLAMLSSSPNVLVINPLVPAKSVQELIALARSKPGELNYGATGIGGLDQLGMELFKNMTGTNIVRVTYKGGAPAVVGILSNEVQMRLVSIGTVGAEVKSGKLRALGVASLTPSALFPELPTIASSGLPGFEIVGIDAMYAPARTPAGIVNQLNREIVRFIRTPDAKEKYLNIGNEVVASTPEEHAAMLKSRISVIGKVIKDAGIKAE